MQEGPANFPKHNKYFMYAKTVTEVGERDSSEHLTLRVDTEMGQYKQRLAM